jgi:hypothetical protein
MVLKKKKNREEKKIKTTKENIVQKKSWSLFKVSFPLFI